MVETVAAGQPVQGFPPGARKPGDRRRASGPVVLGNRGMREVAQRRTETAAGPGRGLARQAQAFESIPCSNAFVTCNVSNDILTR